MNKVFLIGNLTRDPELAETPNGVAVCKFSIAVNRPFSERVTDFFNITTWIGQAENCGKFLKKGSKVAIVGSLQNRTYEDKDGVKRTVTDIVANEVEFLSKTNSSSSEDKNGSQGQNSASQMVLQEVEDDDSLPF